MADLVCACREEFLSVCEGLTVDTEHEGQQYCVLHVPTKPFAVPRKPREANILAPDPGAIFTQGEPVLLMGSGFSPDFETPDFEDMVWKSDVDGPIGIGYQVVTQTLSKGHHRITLTIPDGLGGDISTGMDILVTGVGVL